MATAIFSFDCKKILRTEYRQGLNFHQISIPPTVNIYRTCKQCTVLVYN